MKCYQAENIAILFDNGGEIRASIRHPKDKQFRLKRQK